LLARTHVTHGYAVLIDCHSMPSVVRGQDMRHRPDIVLGDRYGTSCHPDVVETAGRILRDLGFAVARNKPYAGGFITEHYGKPGKQLHALQVEVNRALYMDEKAHEKTSGFTHLQGALAEFSRRLVATGLVRAQSAQAAE
jgi:N-formylglutamate amidohydrolase